MIRQMVRALVILPMVLMSLSAQQLVDGIAAVVGKEIVLRSDIQQYVQNYVVQNKIDIKNNPQLLKRLKSETLEKIIEQKLLLAKAEEDTLKVDDGLLDQKVEERVQYLIGQVGSEDKLEQTFGSPIKKIKRDTRKIIKEQMLVEQARSAKLRNLKVSRREVESFYATYKDSLPSLKETVDISHILKLIKPSEKAQQEAFDKATSILERIKKGEDFAKLAQKYSDDPASARRGGDLGLISRGDFVPEFEAAAYKLKDGEISDIVQTQFGFHIIQMIERRGEKIHTRHILIRLVPSDADDQRVVDELNDIRGKIINGAGFSEMALKYSDDENVTKDRGHLGIFEMDKMVIPEFKTIVNSMKPGEVSQPFKTEFGYHIVKLNDRQTARALSLKSDWDRIEQIALNHKMQTEYMAWIKHLKQTVPIEIKKPL